MRGVTADDHFDPLTRIPPDVIAEVLTRAIAHTDELLAAEIETEGGDYVRIVCIPEVRAWLRTLASRARLGEPMRPPAVEP
jgi:hypothetical protein